MIIGIDIRPLMELEYSGVSQYAFNLLNALFEIDKKNEYKLFYNSFNNQYKKSRFFSNLPNRGNIKYIKCSVPNKIFNASSFCFNFPKIDKIIGKVDVFYSPNFLFSSFSPKCGNILTVHDLSFERCPQLYNLKGRLWHKFVKTKKLCQNASSIIAVSENTKYDIMELYSIAENKIKVVYPGLPSYQSANCRRQDAKYLLPDKFILYLGNVEMRKNIAGIISAFERLNLKEYFLVIAGGRSYGYKKIKERALNSPVANKIKFIDYIKEEDKEFFYKNASLFVYPSFYEGFGFPPLEAMANGTAVICGNASSLPEVAGDSALMVDPYNINDIAKAMAEILTDEKYRLNLIDKGFKRVKKFSWEKCAREMLMILD